MQDFTAATVASLLIITVITAHWQGRSTRGTLPRSLAWPTTLTSKGCSRVTRMPVSYPSTAKYVNAYDSLHFLCSLGQQHYRRRHCSTIFCKTKSTKQKTITKTTHHTPLSLQLVMGQYTFSGCWNSSTNLGSYSSYSFQHYSCSGVFILLKL